MQSESKNELEQALHDAHRTQSLLDATVQSTASGVVICDMDVNFVVINPAARKMLGKIAGTGPEQWSDSVGVFKNEDGLLFEQDELPLARACKGETIDRMELLFRNGIDDDPIWVEVNATRILGLNSEPLGAVTVFNDVTLSRKAREGLRDLQQQTESQLAATNQALARAERLASIGTLAAGIAHEINNPLAAIMLTSELAKARIGMGKFSSEQLDATFDDIKQQVESCAKIVKGVLMFANNETVERTECSVFEIAVKARKLIQFEADKQNVGIEVQPIDGDEPLTSVNETEIGQVIVSLLANAIDASSEESKVHVAVQRVEDRVVCSVIDSGSGMTPEQQLLVFDPFYTSKRTSGGTGLGLSMSHSIITNHGGEIWVERSEPGKGTTFCFALPAV